MCPELDPLAFGAQGIGCAEVIPIYYLVIVFVAFFPFFCL